MSDLTQSQLDVLIVVNNHISKEGWPPTRQEIADARGQFANAAHEQLLRLEEKGYIEIVRGVSRGLRLTDKATILLDSLRLKRSPRKVRS